MFSRGSAQHRCELVIVTDPGPDPDDVKALMVAATLHNLGQVRLRAVIANGGGQPGARARLAKCVLVHAGATDVPVGIGSMGQAYEARSHEYSLPGYKEVEDSQLRDGAELLAQTLERARPKSLTLVCISSLRDVADAIVANEPLFRRVVREIAVQGGLEPVAPSGENGQPRFVADNAVNNGFDMQAANALYDYCFSTNLPLTVVSRLAVPLLSMQLARSFALRATCPMMPYLADAQMQGLIGLWAKLCDGTLPARCTKEWYFDTFCGMPPDVFQQRRLEVLDGSCDIGKYLNGFVKPYDVVALMSILPSTRAVFAQPATTLPPSADGKPSPHRLFLTAADTLPVAHVLKLLRDTYHEVEVGGASASRTQQLRSTRLHADFLGHAPPAIEVRPSSGSGVEEGRPLSIARLVVWADLPLESPPRVAQPKSSAHAVGATSFLSSIRGARSWGAAAPRVVAVQPHQPPELLASPGALDFELLAVQRRSKADAGRSARAKSSSQEAAQAAAVNVVVIASSADPEEADDAEEAGVLSEADIVLMLQLALAQARAPTGRLVWLLPAGGLLTVVLLLCAYLGFALAVVQHVGAGDIGSELGSCSVEIECSTIAVHSFSSASTLLSALMLVSAQQLVSSSGARGLARRAALLTDLAVVVLLLLCASTHSWRAARTLRPFDMAMSAAYGLPGLLLAGAVLAFEPRRHALLSIGLRTSCTWSALGLAFVAHGLALAVALKLSWALTARVGDDVRDVRNAAIVDAALKLAVGAFLLYPPLRVRMHAATSRLLFGGHGVFAPLAALIGTGTAKERVPAELVAKSLRAFRPAVLDQTGLAALSFVGDGEPDGSARKRRASSERNVRGPLAGAAYLTLRGTLARISGESSRDSVPSRGSVSRSSAPSIPPHAEARALSADAFVVHFPRDDPAHKAHALRAWALDFAREHGRPPVVWLEAMCADPYLSSAQRLPHVPVHAARCQRLLLLCGASITEHLQPLVECYVWRASGGSLDNAQVLLVAPPDADQAERERRWQAVVGAFDTFHVMWVGARSQLDATVLTRCVELATVSHFNEAIRALLPVVYRCCTLEQSALVGEEAQHGSPQELSRGKSDTSSFSALGRLITPLGSNRFISRGRRRTVHLVKATDDAAHPFSRSRHESLLAFAAGGAAALLRDESLSTGTSLSRSRAKTLEQ